MFLYRLISFDEFRSFETMLISPDYIPRLAFKLFDKDKRSRVSFSKLVFVVFSCVYVCVGDCVCVCVGDWELGHTLHVHDAVNMHNYNTETTYRFIL